MCGKKIVIPMSVLQEVKPMDPAGFFLGCKNSGSHCGIATFDLPNKHPMSHWLRNSEMSGVIDVFFCFSNLSYFSGSRNHIQDTYFSTAADAVSLPTVLQYQHHLSRQSCIQLQKNAPDTGTLQRKIVSCTFDFFGCGSASKIKILRPACFDTALQILAPHFFNFSQLK